MPLDLENQNPWGKIDVNPWRRWFVLLDGFTRKQSSRWFVSAVSTG
jgi:hypothetical protein